LTRLDSKSVVSLLAMMLLVAGCAAQVNLRPFQSVGPVWPEGPDKARVQFIGEFSGPGDLGIRQSVWSRIVNVWAGSRPDSMIRPMAVVASADGSTIYVADPDTQCLHRYDLRRSRYACLVLPNGDMLPSPVGLAINESDVVLVADSRLAQVLILMPGSDELEALPLDVDLQQPTGLAWDSDSQYFFVADTAGQVVRKFSIDGKQVAQIGSHGDAVGEFNYPTYVWPDRVGGLLVTDSLNFRVQRVDASGTAVFSFGELGDAPGNMSRPKGVAMDSFGHVYVIDALFHAIQIFNGQGELLMVLGEQGQAAGQFWLPNSVFISKENMIYVADSYNRRIQVFRYVGDDT
jgi:sugar lactone lactonase YvrE